MKPHSLFVLAALPVGLGLALAPSAAVAAPAAPNGETLFRQRCQACHSVVPGRPSPVGPNLAGVVGRKAAATAFRYSNALKQSGLTWTRANIDRYLAGSSRMVPGTRMAITIADPAQRAALVTYLSARR